MVESFLFNEWFDFEWQLITRQKCQVFRYFIIPIMDPIVRFLDDSSIWTIPKQHKLVMNHDAIVSSIQMVETLEYTTQK